MPSRIPSLCLSLWCLLHAACCSSFDTAREALPPQESADGDRVDFVTQVKPLLESRCLFCHNTNTLLGHLNLETRALAFQPGPGGPFIVPGRPESSKLYTFTQLSEEHRQAMPPMKHRLNAEEKALLRDWIAQGASWPEGPEGNLRTVPDPAG